MNRGLVLEFTKMHGAGNDFIVIDNRFFFFSEAELADIALRFCPRHFGVGADGVLALEEPREEGTHYHMTYVNADGSLGEMCGNGARCLARFAYEAGIAARHLHFTTVAATYEAFIDPLDPGVVQVIFPVPKTVTPSFTTISTEGIDLDLTFVQAGVPHAVWFDDRIDDRRVQEVGSFVRYHPDFVPVQGANVDFVEVVGRDGVSELRVRCYERGVEAETMACGTGAISSFVAASVNGLIATEEALVRMRGGTLRVGFTEGRRGVFLEGQAATVFRGTLEL